MVNRILVALLLLIFRQVSYAQIIDTTVYKHLLHADKIEFKRYAESVGLQTNFDSLSNMLFAKKPGLVYGKPLIEGSQSYVLEMIVSTQDKANNKSVIQDAKPVEGKPGTWYSNDYLYMEWDLENPISKEMWYKVLIYKRQ
jgi:hypothetical protein